MFGSIPILAQAYGFSADQKGEAAFFKAMERGELAATEDKFLAFAKGLSTAANANGALGAVTKKTRAEMNRFFADITKAKDTIFQSGMGEGIAHMFGSLSDTLQQLEPTTKAFGAAFKGAITMMTQAVRVALFPLEVFQDLLVKIGANSGVTSAKGLWTLVGSGGAFFLMTGWLYRIGKALGFVNISLATTGLMFAKVMAAALVLQDIWVGVQGGDSYSKDFANAAAIAPRWMDFLPAVAITKMYQAQYGGAKVEITVKDSELSKVIEAKVADGSQKQQAALRSDDGG